VDQIIAREKGRMLSISRERRWKFKSQFLNFRFHIPERHSRRGIKKAGKPIIFSQNRSVDE
jgi:hypothetical protein